MSVQTKKDVGRLAGRVFVRDGVLEHDPDVLGVGLGCRLARVEGAVGQRTHLYRQVNPRGFAHPAKPVLDLVVHLAGNEIDEPRREFTAVREALLARVQSGGPFGATQAVLQRLHPVRRNRDGGESFTQHGWNGHALAQQKAQERQVLFPPGHEPEREDETDRASARAPA